jgi:hypothetical protein
VATGNSICNGQRVRLRVDAQGCRAGDTGRVLRVERRHGALGEVSLYWCEVWAGGAPRLAAFHPEEVEPSD